MRSPALWLYLLAAVTVLVIVLRRVLHRQMPLSDEIYAKQVALEHVHSGVAWVRSDGTVGSANPALAKTLAVIPRELVGTLWLTMFPMKDRSRLEDAYRQALLQGKISLKVDGQRPDGTLAKLDLLIVSIHDHKTRFIGHYCFIRDLTREVELEDQIEKLSSRITARGR